MIYKLALVLALAALLEGTAADVKMANRSDRDNVGPGNQRGTFGWFGCPSESVDETVPTNFTDLEKLFPQLFPARMYLKWGPDYERHMSCLIVDKFGWPPASGGGRSNASPQQRNIFTDILAFFGLVSSSDPNATTTEPPPTTTTVPTTTVPVPPGAPSPGLLAILQFLLGLFGGGSSEGVPPPVYPHNCTIEYFMDGKPTLAKTNITIIDKAPFSIRFTGLPYGSELKIS
ncbi:uncharacterized protein LOC108667086 [Hyalella azteca]|uniref:Uncharacterized protein LOC108667086 n=1 Tax=Hyalella azteca TaxID=294128 RepID=A0A8B7N8F1_HYAAZ|nr:uncharacterized protein LOC108667086 [Hyalella azteca]